jgi:hypothetical protein
MGSIIFRYYRPNFFLLASIVDVQEGSVEVLCKNRTGSGLPFLV